MPLPSPDRGTEIERAMAIARASRSPLGFCGRVDDRWSRACQRPLPAPAQAAGHRRQPHRRHHRRGQRDHRHHDPNPARRSARGN